MLSSKREVAAAGEEGGEAADDPLQATESTGEGLAQARDREVSLAALKAPEEELAGAAPPAQLEGRLFVQEQHPASDAVTGWSLLPADTSRGAGLSRDIALPAARSTSSTSPAGASTRGAAMGACPAER